MSLSTEEAQELIAEIKKVINFNDRLTDKMISVDYVDYHIEKIITRFANKPPYELELVDGSISLSTHEDYRLCNLEMEFDREYDIVTYAMALDSECLKQLRDNCNKMLEYLKDQ